MVFAKTERLLVEHLKEAGERLIHPPSNVGELLSLLDQVECCLSWISKSLSKSIKNALRHMKKALVTDDLMRHSDIDVRVAVASCISEVTRISAAVTPYDDDEQMKKVFRLIVDAFEGLSDSSSPSYSKRVSILASMAMVRSCLVMMNLGCDAMILEMFQHFLFSIRDSHREHFFSDMETIMTLVLKESDDVSAELLSLLIDSVQKDVLPMRRKLAEKVIGNCVAKLKPATIHHETVFAAECDGANAKASGEHPAIESKSLEKAAADTIPQEANEVSLKATGSGLLDLAQGRSSQSVVTDDDSLTYPSSRNTDEAKTTDTEEKIEPDNLESKMAVKPETEPGQAIKRTREVHYPPERSFDSSNSRAESRFAVIKEWERREKKKAAYEAVKKLYAIESWEKSKRAALEAQLERIEEPLEREKAEYVEKMKNEVALLHKEAEEKRAMIEAKNGEEILKAEEIAGKRRASGTTPTTPMTPPVLPVYFLAFVGALLVCVVILVFVEPGDGFLW